MSSRKVAIVQDTSNNSVQFQPSTAVTAVTAVTTLAKIPRKGCCGCGRETEEERYESVLETAIIDEHYKNSVRRRYIHLLNEFQSRAFHYSLLYHLGHLIITVGSLIVPALLSVQYTNSLADYQTNI